MQQTDITPLLDKIKKGQPGASEELIGRVYKELRKLAAVRMRREQPGHTLQPTALVHEVYLRLVADTEGDLKNRAEFFAAAVNLMRHILIDHARAKQAQKRGGDAVQITLDDVQISSAQSAEELIAVHESLERLAAIAPRQATIVELRFFGGLSIQEIADILEIVPRTVDRDWRAARVWLRRELKPAHATSL